MATSSPPTWRVAAGPDCPVPARPFAPDRLAPQHQDVLVGDVRDEHARIPVRAQPCPRLVPDEVALGHEAGGVGTGRQIGPHELVAAGLVGVADDDDRVAARTQDARELD